MYDERDPAGGWVPMTFLPKLGASGGQDGSVETEVSPSAGESVSGTSSTRGAQASLRAKALLAFLGAVLYISGVGVYLQAERTRLTDSVGQLEALHVHDELLARVNAAAAHATLTVNEAYHARDRAVNWGDVAIALEALQAGLYALSTSADAFAVDAVRLQPMIGALMRNPERAALIEVRDLVYGVVHRLDAVTSTLRERKQTLSRHYRDGFDGLTLKAAAFAMLGLTVFGTMAAYFFARMAWDIRRLQRRALRIVDGYRGAPLPVTRGDEIGELMESLNRMQAELRARERRLELARQEQVHREKMAAVGTLAAAIAHEINNPIAAIVGVAEEIADTREERMCPHHGAACRPDLILEHTRRVSMITRHISNFSAPRSREPELLELNSLVESTCSFVHYDRRYKDVEIETDLDRSIPAVQAVADHITQILMNLLLNAADACTQMHPRPGRVRVSTRRGDDCVELTVTDNGCGMDEATLARAFEEYFTTKTNGRGTGLGLALCGSLARGFGGSIRLESEFGEGTRARLGIPVAGTVDQ